MFVFQLNSAQYSGTNINKKGWNKIKIYWESFESVQDKQSIKWLEHRNKSLLTCGKIVPKITGEIYPFFPQTRLADSMNFCDILF
jgi:phage protein U